MAYLIGFGELISMVCAGCRSAWCTTWTRCQRCGFGEKMKPGDPPKPKTAKGS